MPKHATLPARAQPATRGAAFPWRAAALLVLVALATYAPILDAGFVWDDAGHLTAPELRGASGLWKLWSDPRAAQQYYPLVHSLFWLEMRLWGAAPLGYHLVQLALHVAAALLAWRLAARLGLPAAFALGLVFAVHPVQVETVAWISEHKNTLSACCYLGAWHAWLAFDASRGTARRPGVYALSLGLALAAALAKTVTLTLVPAILLLTWWREGGRGWLARLPWLVPHLALGVGLGLTTAWLEVHVGGARGDAYDLTLAQRVIVAGKDLWFYLGRLAWPHPLSFVYPRWDPARFGPADWIAPLGFVALLGATWIWRGRLTRGPFAALAFFAGTLAPALGFVNAVPFAFSFVADHFQYLAAAGPLALLVGCGARLLAGRPLLARVVLGGWVAVLALLSFRHARDFRDEPTLWRATLRTNPAAWIAWENLLDLENRARRFDVALELSQRALEHHPERAPVHVQRGIALQQTGAFEQALACFERACALDPRSVPAEFDRASVLHALGRDEEALAAVARVLALEPDLAQGWMLRGNALLALGRHDEALAAHERALALDPGDAQILFNLGVTRARRGESAQAIAAWRRALELDPGRLDARLNLAVALATAGEPGAARVELERVVREGGTSPIAARARAALAVLPAQDAR